MSWETTRGLLSNYSGTITDGRFKFDPRYNEGQTLILELDIKTDDPTTPQTTESYGCGKGWTTDDGKSARRSDGGDKFNKSSWYGRFIEYVKADEKALAVVAKRGDPTQVATWIGTTWRFDEIEVDFGKIGDENVKSARNMPVEFLGEGEVEAKADQLNSIAADDQLMEKLTEIAQSVSNHGEFVREALQVEGVHPIIDQVADESDSGLYAKLQS